MVREFDVVVESQLGQRRGKLLLTESGEQIYGTLHLLKFENPVTGERKGNTIVLCHELRTIFSCLSCRTELELDYEGFHGIIKADKVNMKIWGKHRPASEKLGQQV